MCLIVYSNDHAPLTVRLIYSSSKLRTVQMMIFSLVAMIGLAKCCITSACLQWLCHSGERIVARGPLVCYYCYSLLVYCRELLISLGSSLSRCNHSTQKVLYAETQHFLQCIRSVWSESSHGNLIMKTCLFKYSENFTTKKWKFSDEKFLYFTYFWSKHRLWVLVRTALMRRF